MSPPPGLSDPYDEFKDEIRNHIEFILRYYDGINTRSLAIQKELNQLKYFLDLKKSRSLTSTSDDDDRKVYVTRQKLYLNKLNTKHILLPNQTTLDYYKVKFEHDIYIYVWKLNYRL